LGFTRITLAILSLAAVGCASAERPQVQPIRTPERGRTAVVDSFSGPAVVGHAASWQGRAAELRR
jgi:hypothetical protein